MDLNKIDGKFKNLYIPTIIKMTLCKPIHIPCRISITCFLLSVASGVAYLFADSSIIDNDRFGEIAIYTIAVTLLMWIINVNIQKDDKTSTTRSHSTKVSPVAPVTPVAPFV
jgi:hypothetical protein